MNCIYVISVNDSCIFNILTIQGVYILSHFNAKVQCDAAVIRELCESRDSCSDLLFSRKELEVFIEMLCIK